MLKESLIAKTNGKANDKQIKIVGDTRITYLTSKLIRVEIGEFTDDASQAIWFREFEAGEFSVKEQKVSIIVETEDRIFNIKKSKPYSVTDKSTGHIQYFDKQENLKGTRRTLDECSGEVKLDDGIITKEGAYVFDDSSTMLLDRTGHFVSRNGGKDYYLFAYGNDYRETIKAFYQISSPVPIVPRFALGVWWSRYHAYTQEEYLDLMDKFEEEGVPLTVATVDMDWHWVHDINERFGVKYGGWTGYSWDTSLFPDYKQFLKDLKAKNLHITLNLHPADGVHSYENMYEEMAKAVGIDPKTKKNIKFQCGNDDFWNAYFDILHKPYERDGVDFWWIDWQQGKHSDVKGLDPLPALNHYHTLDNAEDGRIPMILSRYAGLGSHRYPLGFSGDTSINWETLNFQPYMTLTASNAAYSWWSHDIGGHHYGYRDDDLYLRWLQFGVFSPIMRLHSTADQLLGKEPWKYNFAVHKSAVEWLKLRHKLIPYIYTMDYRTHKDGISLCEPMYYTYKTADAFTVRNEYKFGSELIVAPITQRQFKENNMGGAQVYIPEGRWVDIFTNQAYNGSRTLMLQRDLDTIPVLAKEGAIIPMSAEEGNSVENPKKFEIWAFSGNSEFTLIEDNAKVDFEEHLCKTTFKISYENSVVKFSISKADGDTSVIPQKRSYKVLIKDLGVEFNFDDCDVNEEYEQSVEAKRIAKQELQEAVILNLSRWQETTPKKRSAYEKLEKCKTDEELLKAIPSAKLPKPIEARILEYIAEI